MRSNNVGTDRDGIPIYGPSPTAGIGFIVNGTTEKVIPWPIIDGRAPISLVVTAFGGAVYFTIDQNDQPNSIVMPTSEGTQNMQMLIYGSRTVDMPREWGTGAPGPLYIHFSGINNADTVEMNIEFRH